MKITKDSHVDHDLTADHKEWILDIFSDRNEFFIEEVEMPSDLPPLPSALYGPSAGDIPVKEGDVFYEKRGDRPYESRMIDAPKRPSRLMTIIAGPHEGDSCILYTAFGGPLTPKEPGDKTLGGYDREDSKVFWSRHALAK